MAIFSAASAAVTEARLPAAGVMVAVNQMLIRVS
jgi:hypothetical protein